MPRSIWFHGMIIAAAAALTGCRGSMTDQQLIQAVRTAASGGATPQTVESRVGAKPIINTVRPGDREKYLFAHVELDNDEQSEVPSLEAQELAYWGRPVTSENPKVVGIAWLADGTAKVFFAVVYPPG